jgi:SAM-dependent methyltransferase
MRTPPRHGKLVTPQSYRAEYDPLAGFERVCTLARQRRCLAFLAEARPRRILEVGCGAMMLAEMARDLGLDHQLWAVVEPEPDFIAAARAALAHDPRFTVHPGYLEDLVPALRAQVPEGFDAVLLSGLLHETAAPQALLAAALALTAPGGQVLATVPNAQSFHRLLAVEAGLIADPATLSSRDLALGHPVVLDAAGLRDLLQAAGLRDLRLDGYLFKPLTNAQMETVLAEAPEALVDGLIALGRRFPDQAAEICAIGRKPR